jgi:hypothetical protein
MRRSRKGRPLPALSAKHKVERVKEHRKFNKNKEGVEVFRLPHLIQRIRVARVEGQGVVVLLYTFYPLFSLSPLSYIQKYRCMSMMYGGI